MACKYEYYKPEEIYFPRLYCKINNKYCIYSKKCNRPGVEKFIPQDNQQECYLYNMEIKKDIPNGSKYIEFERNGYLYIDIDDNHTIKVKNTLGEVNQNYIYIREGLDDYDISLVPFTLKSYRKKNEETRNKAR